ncbi:hypothetical protein PsorP6_010346 [Peronosclerospora sorghi]|uniref:Uncharacterized protein n=1 Tax=Peronosclerospora sorghi TaxID=230839 RepID=A0ACC0VVP1_9STRA|nr:hypothetical protein PsorP6_010346 [Peronosclerospora sorghi]
MQEDGHEPASSGRELTKYQRINKSTLSDNMVFRTERERIRRAHEPVILPGNDSSIVDEHKIDGDDDPDNDKHFYPHSPKRPRFDEDSLLAEAVLTYAASVAMQTTNRFANEGPLNVLTSHVAV